MDCKKLEKALRDIPVDGFRVALLQAQKSNSVLVSLTLLLTTLQRKLWRDARSRQALSSQTKPNRASEQNRDIDPPRWLHQSAVSSLRMSQNMATQASNHTGVLIAVLAEGNVILQGESW
jgi:hypothetical protein